MKHIVSADTGAVKRRYALFIPSHDYEDFREEYNAQLPKNERK
jgi:hypothetical protein